MTPEEVTQDETTGVNNIEKAKVAMMGFPFAKGDLSDLHILEFDKDVQAKLKDFNENSTYIVTHLFSEAALQDAFSSDIFGDLALV